VGILIITPSLIQAIYIHNYNKENIKRKLIKENSRRHATVPETRLKIREISRTSRISK
jgi:hypothetical protein